MLLREISAFGVVGIINLGIDIVLFNLLHQAVGLGPLTSKVLATCVSATTAYFMHRKWSFAHRARTGLRREYTLFFLLNGIGLAIGLLVIAVVRYGFDRGDVFALNVANLVGIGLGTIFRYLTYRRFVFLPADAEGQAVPR